MLGWRYPQKAVFLCLNILLVVLPSITISSRVGYTQIAPCIPSSLSTNDMLRCCLDSRPRQGDGRDSNLKVDSSYSQFKCDNDPAFTLCIQSYPSACIASYNSVTYRKLDSTSGCDKGGHVKCNADGSATSLSKKDPSRLQAQSHFRM